MEFFYREMRRKYALLMEPDGTPTGGQWNFDKDNRKPPRSGMHVPKRIAHPKSRIIKEVLALVASRFGEHFGTLEPFHFAVTRAQALIELAQFIDELLPTFGDYQDAMVAGDPYLYHSLLSCYLNAGLLLPLEICQAVEAAYRAGKAPLHCAEVFIRQILGWREYVRGTYWLHMPGYAERNYLEAHRQLPEFYWTAETGMFCMAEAIRHTRDHAYSHHIQRLMLTGNFALLAGLEPAEVCEWYLIVYADAYEWVELPNVLGMALYGDGGIMGSKPYAASGKYIPPDEQLLRALPLRSGRGAGGDSLPIQCSLLGFHSAQRGKTARRPAADLCLCRLGQNGAGKAAGHPHAGIAGAGEAGCGRVVMPHKKLHLPTKTCPVCQRSFSWRKKWDAVWGEIKYCSERCRRSRRETPAPHLPPMP